jgi:hypothetical protein
VAILIPGKRFYRQPLNSEPVFIAPQWRKDFAYAIIGNRQMLVPGLVGGRFKEQRNYAVVPSKFGTLMGRKFAASGGGDTLDIDTFTAITGGNVQASYLAIVYPQSPQDYCSIIDHADKSGLQMVGGSGLNVRQVQTGGLGYNYTFSPEPTLTNNAVNVVATTLQSVGGAYITGNCRIALNGKLYWNTAAAYVSHGTTIGGASTLLGKNYYAANRNWSGTIPLVAVWNRSFTDAELYALNNDPWQVFVTRSFYSNRSIWLDSAAAGGGTTFDIAIAETLTAADAPDAALVAGIGVAETASAADATSIALTTSTEVAETLAAADAPTLIVTADIAVAETLAAADAPTLAVAAGIAVAETLSATDAPSASLIAGIAIAEATSIADVCDALLIAGIGVAEALSAADVADVSVNTNTYNIEILESAAAVDAANASLITSVAIAEAASAVDAQNAALIAGIVVAEATAAADAVNLAVAAGIAVAEALSAVDTQDMPGATTYGIQVVEVLTAQDILDTDHPIVVLPPGTATVGGGGGTRKAPGYRRSTGAPSGATLEDRLRMIEREDGELLLLCQLLTVIQHGDMR